jgi:hypothetical protein
MNNNYCFSILALLPKYQFLAKRFAKTLETYSPETTVIIGTDNPSAFQDFSNVLAFKFQKKGVLHCYHDKRFVIEKALTKFKTVIQIDADTNIINHLPTSINPSFGLAVTHIENLVSHTQKYNPERLVYLHKLADKLELDLNTISYIGESLFAVSADQNQVSEFIRQWGFIARYLELHRIHAGEGNAIGLAAAKAKLEIIKPPWLEQINEVRQHFDASQLPLEKKLWDQFKQKLDYHYRFNKARITALKDFDLYYR